MAFFIDSKHVTFGYMVNPDVCYEVSAIWSFLDADRVVSFLTTDDDQYVGFMIGASLGFCGDEFATPTTSVRLFPMVLLIVLDRGLSWMKNFSRLRLVDPVLFGSGPSLDVKGRQRPFSILADHVGPVEGIADGSIPRQVWSSGVSR